MSPKSKDQNPDFKGIGYSKIGFFKETRSKIKELESLNIELARVGAGQPTPKTLSLFDLSRPDIDWLGLSTSMGVPATRATTAEEFHEQLAEALRNKGPRLIEAVVVQQMPG